MFWIDKKSYKRTLAILKKEQELTPMFLELKKFMESEFGLTIYNIVYEPYSAFNRPKKYFLNYGKRASLIFHVASYEERESMQNKIFVENISGHLAYKMRFDEQKQAHVMSKFFGLAKKFNLSVGAEADEIWIDYYYWFPIDYMSFIVSKVEKQTSKAIIRKYKKKAGIWKIYSNGYVVIVFYKTETQKYSNGENGISNAIKKEYFSAINDIDELGFYKDEYIMFDSKENLDKNYGGNLYYYMK